METLYTRSEDGCDPVFLREDGTYLWQRPGNSPLVFPTARQLLIAVTQHEEARHWTFDRYFRLGKFSPPGRNFDAPIFDALGLGGWAVDPTSLTTPSGLVRVTRRHKGTGREDGLGIDLEKRGKEVAKLLFAGFSGKIRAKHYDPEDVLQEVFKGILIRNQGTCPFDAKKASFGHYVHMVCSCVLSNYHRRAQRYQDLIQEGLPGWDESGDQTFVDVGEQAPAPLVPVEDSSEGLALADAAALLGKSPHRALALRILPFIGHDRTWIANELGVSKAAVTKACAFIRKELQASRESCPFL